MPIPTPPNDDDHLTVDDNTYEDINTSATESSTPPPAPAPAPEIVRAAIKYLYPKYLTLGRKKLLRILNAEKGWGIGSKEFRLHLESISGRTENEMSGDGD